METPADLPLLGFSRREDPRDALVLPLGREAWDRDLPVGCASRRRMLQLAALYPDATFQLVRGNVLTRLAKLDGGQYGALILAAAGLKRLGLEERISRYFAPEEMIPAAGQGVLCVQGRAGEDYSCLEPFFDRDAAVTTAAERAFVTALDGGCSSPVAAFAQVEDGEVHLRGSATARGWIHTPPARPGAPPVTPSAWGVPWPPGCGRNWRGGDGR